MEFLSTIKALVPDYAKDIRLNLDGTIARSSLEGNDAVGVALAAAFAAKSTVIVDAIRNAEVLSPEETNGALTAEVRPPDAAHGFYRGTRFDQAGVVTSLKLKGRDFYGPWFERTAPQVLDYTYVGDDLVAGPDSAISGPVEEFAPLDFQPKAL